jgi:hypothetical protein
MSDQAIEQEIQDKGLTAPRVTPSDIEANIDTVYYFTAGDGVHGVRLSEGEERSVYHSSLDLLIFCTIVLKNGFTVTGESACASPENFNAEIGRKIARQNAIDKIWPLMGYELKQRLHQADQSKPCQGKNCHVVAGSADTHHSLECQEETTYTYAGEPQPEALECEKAVEARWAAIQPKAAD